jgi:hypothetical protein
MDLLPFFMDEDLEDEELLALYFLQKKNYFYHLDKSLQPFVLDGLTDEFCWVHFRFLKDDLLKLKTVLAIPNVLKCSNFVTVGGMEALCILLKRLAYPNRYP